MQKKLFYLTVMRQTWSFENWRERSLPCLFCSFLFAESGLQRAKPGVDFEFIKVLKHLIFRWRAKFEFDKALFMQNALRHKIKGSSQWRCGTNITANFGEKTFSWTTVSKSYQAAKKDRYTFSKLLEDFLTCSLWSINTSLREVNLQFIPNVS